MAARPAFRSRGRHPGRLHFARRTRGDGYDAGNLLQQRGHGHGPGALASRQPRLRGDETDAGSALDMRGSVGPEQDVPWQGPPVGSSLEFPCIAVSRVCGQAAPPQAGHRPLLRAQEAVARADGLPAPVLGLPAGRHACIRDAGDAGSACPSTLGTGSAPLDRIAHGTPETLEGIRASGHFDMGGPLAKAPARQGEPTARSTCPRLRPALEQ